MNPNSHGLKTLWSWFRSTFRAQGSVKISDYLWVILCYFRRRIFGKTQIPVEQTKKERNSSERKKGKNDSFVNERMTFFRLKSDQIKCLSLSLVFGSAACKTSPLYKDSFTKTFYYEFPSCSSAMVVKLMERESKHCDVQQNPRSWLRETDAWFASRGR